MLTDQQFLILLLPSFVFKINSKTGIFLLFVKKLKGMVEVQRYVLLELDYLNMTLKEIIFLKLNLTYYELLEVQVHEKKIIDFWGKQSLHPETQRSVLQTFDKS